ncbi:PREDICTED: protein PIN-LIKES 7-like isoform X2 [Lupinus angustifolius]|nr:PREDICTED: protein PIN-LIKES 7-like isoform X2 [Lupinus angustifolius]
MPVNVGLTFLIGGILGWILVKSLKPNLKLEGLIIASCSAGNMGNLPIVIIPAICDEKGGPFGRSDACHSNALSYASFSMALGGIFIWTHTYQTIKSRSLRYKALEAAGILKIPNKDLDANAETLLLKGGNNENTILEVPTSDYIGDTENQSIQEQDQSAVSKNRKESSWYRAIEVLRHFVAELLSPPAIATFFGFLFGTVAWLKNLIVGDYAPFAVIQDTLVILGNGTIPCITLLLGGNLTQGLKSSSVKPLILISIIIARFFVLPVIGFFIVKAAANFGLLPLDPLFQYVLVMQYVMPPAMNISTMAQLFDVGNEECAVILLWTYVAAAIALTVWSTFLMSVLS